MSVLRRDIVPLFLNPVPSSDTLAAWFRTAGIPHTKANPGARRGGGPVWWHVARVEDYLRQLTTRHG